MFARFNMDAAGRTGGCAQKTRRAADGTVIFERQAVTAAIDIRIAPAFFGVLHGIRRAFVFC
jgi:hypothetical protein